MRRFVLSIFSVLLAAGATAPMGQAANIQQFSDFQKLRIAELDIRNKDAESEKPFSLHQLRIEEASRRNKVGDKLSTTPLMTQRDRLLDRSESK
ncbi:MAG: hypothetical protein WBD47_17455 [Phormidesmis sp.]